MPSTFPCPACGGPNKPKAGLTKITCSYCGVKLTIPAALRTAANPKVEKIFQKVTSTTSIKGEAPDLLRKAQPVAVKAWNAYAWWTWIRRALPTCLIILATGFCVCGLLSILPFFVRR